MRTRKMPMVKATPLLLRMSGKRIYQDRRPTLLPMGLLRTQTIRTVT